MAPLDVNKKFPNQLIDNDPTECVVLAITDILGNSLGQLFDPDYSYALTLALQGLVPNTNGLDPYSAMVAAIVYGVLPISDEAFTSKVMGELYTANIQNYALTDLAAALKFAQSNFKTFHVIDDYQSYLSTYKMGAMICMDWYASFTTNTSGVLEAPNTGDPFSSHCPAVYDFDPVKGLLIKPWLGENYGQGGYVWLSPAIFEQVFQSGYGFTPNGRWVSLVNAWLSYPHGRPYIWPQILSCGTI
jgi:hypothetical protein